MYVFPDIKAITHAIQVSGPRSFAPIPCKYEKEQHAANALFAIAAEGATHYHTLSIEYTDARGRSLQTNLLFEAGPVLFKIATGNWADAIIDAFERLRGNPIERRRREFEAQALHDSTFKPLSDFRSAIQSFCSNAEAWKLVSGDKLSSPDPRISAAKNAGAWFCISHSTPLHL
jgi:hypothetical protein